MAKANGSTAAPRKTECSVTREEFKQLAPPIQCQLGNLGSVVAAPKDFSTGSFGWNANGKITVILEGKAVDVQVGINLTVVGSKEAK